jgi:ribosomal protein L16 Arg81 hydroxylase
MAFARVGAHRALPYADLLRGYVETCTPVLLRGAVEDWPARRKWTKQFFCEQYPDVQVQVINFVERGHATCSVKDYLCLPRSERAKWYLCDWNFRKTQPELLRDIKIPWAFPNDWLHDIPAANRPDLLWIYIGHAGTRGRAHIDNFGTSAWLAVLQGNKRVRFATRKKKSKVDFSTLDLFSDEQIDGVEITEARMKAGDLLFVPAGTWHAAMNPSYCLSVTANFVEGSCFGHYRQFWLNHWHGEKIMTAEIKRLSLMERGEDKECLTAQLQLALHHWRKHVLVEQDIVNYFTRKLADLP